MQTKRVRRVMWLVWASVVLIGQGGLWPVAGAPQSYLGEQAADSVPSTETRLTRAPGEGDGAAVAAAEASWPMVGANPERTSWTSEEVRGALKPLWYRPIEPYIPAKVQIIAANDTLYISTAKGLYALEASTGNTRWVYPTELPLGNSPTITNGVAYVGGLDNKLHAVNALTGQGLWTFPADAGFDTNPLVMGGLVYAGNRNGYMYAVYANEDSRRGLLAWQYPPAGQAPIGPIHFSAAYKNNTIYFASDDAYAYALNATTGVLMWKSQKLPTAGFRSWWPVIDGNAVILSASRPYRPSVPPPNPNSVRYTLDEPGRTGTFGPLQADGTRDASSIFNFFEREPWLRSYYILNVASGQEVTYDFDSDGKLEYGPLLSYGTHSGNRYPAVIGQDGTVFTANHYNHNSNGKYDNGVSGWKLGARTITTRMNMNNVGLTWDEPLAYSMGGNVIYWTQCCDRQGGAFDTATGSTWAYYQYTLPNLVPGYDAGYAGHGDSSEANATAVFGGNNGVYGTHGDQNPPIPYKGRVYVHRSNTVIAWSSAGGAQKLPTATTVQKQDAHAPLDTIALRQKLAGEIQKMIAAGHLRPGFGVNGLFSDWAKTVAGDNLTDYWSNPADTISTLTRALPYLSPDLASSLRTYLNNEYSQYSPCKYTHIGWDSGAAREWFDLPPEVQADLGKNKYPPLAFVNSDFAGWNGWTPHSWYAAWKYAQAFGNAKSVFDSCKASLSAPPTDAILAQYPFAHNAWIAGYWGYLELQKLAGYSEDAAKRATLNRLLSLRVSSFARDIPGGPEPKNKNQPLGVARNFIYLTPELGGYLHDHALSQVSAAVAEYERVAPYWFVTNFEATYNEGVIQHLYDNEALFAAEAWILDEPAENLVRYLDVPGFARGDLFYIGHLITLLEGQGIPVAQAQVTKLASKLTARRNDVIIYTLTASNLCTATLTTIPVTVTDRLPTGMNLNTSSCKSSATPLLPTCSGSNVTWKGNLSPTGTMVISYTAQVIITTSASLVNQMKVDAGTCGIYSDTWIIKANPLQVYLPLVLKGAGR